MKAYVDNNIEREFRVAREFPWVNTSYDLESGRPAGRYFDFKVQPELIESSLEDFLPWKQEPAIQQFFSFLRWINGPQSRLETDDCAFGGEPKPHNDPGFLKWKLRCDGRVMIFNRDLIQNTKGWAVNKLRDRLTYQLTKVDPKFDPGAVGIGRAPVDFVSCPRNPPESNGASLELRFFAFGSNRPDTFKALERVFRGMLQGAKRLSDELG